MPEYDDQPQPQKIKIDVDDLRRQLPDLAREFAVLVNQEMRMLSSAQDSEDEKPDPNTGDIDHLSPDNINRIMGNAETTNALSGIAADTRSILEAVKAIPAAIQQIGGV